MADKPRIMIGAVDITYHVAVMYDAIVASTDWGSGFLCTEDIESIAIVAHLAGYDHPVLDPTSAPPALLSGMTQIDVYDSKNREEIRAAWAAQIAAKAKALLDGKS